MHQIKRDFKTYDFIFSLGEWCGTAMALKRQGLRSFSGPFDWVAGENIISRTAILCNDMKNYLTQKDLVLTGHIYEPELHDRYLNQANGISFVHDFPLGKPITETFDNIKQKYNRRIQRLLKTLNKKIKVLIVYMDLPEKKEKIAIKDVQQCAEKLNKHFAADIDILYLHDNPAIQEGYTQVFDGKNTFFVECHLTDTTEHPLNDELFCHILSGFHCTQENKNKRYFSKKKLYHKFKTFFIEKRFKAGESYWRILGIKCFKKKITTQ